MAIQPVFPYFLKTKLGTLDEATREALQEGFKNHYLGLARSYNRWMKSKEAQERQWGIDFCRLEYENLYNALQICLEKQETVDIFFCLDKYFELINDIQSRLKLSEFVCQAQEVYPSELRTGEIGLHIVMALGTLANCYLQTQKYQEAKKSYLKIVELTQQLSGVEERQKQSVLATTYHNLGRVAQELREWEQAQAYYQQALDLKIEFSDRYSQASTYGELGIVAQELQEWEQAQAYYQQALNIFIAFSDRFSQAGTYRHLGRVAEELREWSQAQAYYTQALDIFIAFSDRYNCAGTYHSLGIVAQELREWEQAKAYYTQALDIFIAFSDRYNCAGTYAVLGWLAEAQEDYTEARANLQTALKIYVEYQDEYMADVTRANLERLPDDSGK